MVPLPSGPNQGMKNSRIFSKKWKWFLECVFFSPETRKMTLIDGVFNKWIELVQVILLKKPFPMQKMVRFFEYFST